MIPYERKQILLAELEKQEVVNLESLCTALSDVSESTIRRDLKTLEKEGQITLLRGGATKAKSGSYDTPLISRSLLRVKEKEKIARAAADLIKDGDVVYIDAGSTPLLMIKYLKHKEITIVTTNAMVFSEIADTQIHCVMVGGDILNSTASIVGPLTDSTLQEMYFDKAFIGATGYNLESGINTPDLREANKKKIVKNNSNETYVLVDSSKEGKRTMCKAFDISECTLIVEKETDFLMKYATYIIAK